MVPACYFAISLAGFRARSAFPLRCRNWFAPTPAASMLQARCIFAGNLIQPHSPSPLPSGNFRSLGIKAFNGRCRCAVRLPNSPDLRSLPAGPNFLSLDQGYGSSSLPACKVEAVQSRWYVRIGPCAPRDEISSAADQCSGPRLSTHSRSEPAPRNALSLS